MNISEKPFISITVKPMFSPASEIHIFETSLSDVFFYYDSRNPEIVGFTFEELFPKLKKIVKQLDAIHYSLDIWRDYDCATPAGKIADLFANAC